MNKSIKIILSVSVFCFLVIAVTWASRSGRVHSETQPQREIGTKPGLQRINDKAKAVKGPDKAAIRGLTDEIMSQYGWDSAPKTVSDSLKDRLVSAEEGFHSGTHRGISEVEVARAVNGFVIKFRTPAYTWTSPSEVKEIRGRLLTLVPDFVGRGRVVNGRPELKKRGAKIAEMSPLEAAYTTMAVVYQKMYNPDFQLTQAERRASWIEKHSRSRQTFGKGDALPSNTATDRQQEMEAVFRRVATTTTLNDLYTLPDKVLDVLGIERQKKEDK